MKLLFVIYAPAVCGNDMDPHSIVVAFSKETPDLLRWGGEAENKHSITGQTEEAAPARSSLLVFALEMKNMARALALRRRSGENLSARRAADQYTP